MAKKIAIISTLVILLVGIGVGGWFVYNELVKPQLAYANAKSVMVEVDTVEFTYTQTADVEYDFNDIYEVQIDPFEYSSIAEGSFDVDEEQLYLDMTVDMGDLLGSSTAEMYLKDDDISMTINGELYEGTTDEIGDIAVSISDVREEQVWSGLGDAEYVFEGMVEVDGKDAYRYDIKMEGADLSGFEDDLVSFAQDMLDGMEIDMEIGEAVIEGISYKIWVSVDDLSPLKEELIIEEMTIDVPNLFDLSFTDYITVYNYKSVNQDIEVPSL